MWDEDVMTRISHPPNRSRTGSREPFRSEKVLRVLLAVRDAKTTFTWRAFACWSVPGEIIAEARERWSPTRPDAKLFLRISALPDEDGGNGGRAVSWDIPLGYPRGACSLIEVEGARSYTLLLGLLRPGKVFHAVAGPMVFHAPTVRARRHVSTPEEEEPSEWRSARRRSPTSENDRRGVR